MKPETESEHQELDRLRKRVKELEAVNRRLEEKSSAMLNLMEDLENAKVRLEASEYKYRTLSEASPEMIYLIDSEGVVRHVNRSAAQAFGGVPDAIIGRHLRDLFPPELAERHLNNINRVLQTGETVSSEVLESFPNGSRWIDAKLTPIRDESGKWSGVLGLSEDISERKRAEAALRESEGKFRQIVERSNDIFYYQNFNTGKFEYVSSKAMDVLGDLPEEILNMGIEEQMERIHPDDLPGLVNFRTELYEADMKGDKRFSREFRMRNKRGEYRWIHGNYSLVHDAEGKPRSIVGSLTDLTERRQAEEALKQSEFRNKTIVDLTTDYVFIVDVEPDGRLKMRWASDNMRRMTGRSTESIGASDLWGNIIHPGDRERFYDYMKRMIATSREGDFECRSFNADGLERNIRIFVKPQTDDNGVVISVIGAVVDITNQKRAEEALRESEEKYKALIEATDTGYVIVDEQGRVLDANMNYVHLTGHYSLKDILNRPVTEWTAPYDMERNGREVAKCLKNGFVYDLEIDYLHPSGKIVPIGINAHVLQTEQGVRIVTLCRNVSKRKHELDTLRESEEKFRLMAEHMIDVLFTTDIKGVLTYVSPSVEEIFGIKSDQMHGRPLTDLLPQNEKTKARKAFRKTLDSFAPIQNLNLTFERKTGGLFFGEMRLSPIVLNKGISCVVGLIRDIEKRSLMEEELRDSELKFRNFIEQSAEGIIIADNRGRIIEWNRALEKITGLKKSETLGRMLWNVQHEVTRLEHHTPKQLKRVKAEILDMLKTGKPLFGDRTVEVAVQRKDGELRQIQQTVFTFSINKETWIGTVMNDITDRKRIEESLKISHKLFQSLYENSIDGLYRISPELKRFERLTTKQDQDLRKLREQITALKARIGKMKNVRDRSLGRKKSK